MPRSLKLKTAHDVVYGASTQSCTEDSFFLLGHRAHTGMAPGQLQTCLSRSLRPLETSSFVRLCPRGAGGREALGAMQCFASTKCYFVIHFWKDAFRIKAMPGGAVSWWELYPTWPSESANQLHFPVSLFLPCCRNVSWSIWHKHQWPPSLVCLFSCQGAFLFLFILL